ncbi:ParB/RepB/Spo0J family partition protein [Mesorhizobium sp. BR-1-1-10]|uniref:ParB/RepB/Spo0J family partition protein n=1 Tax=Mesorhizobium sp. BR-1-1-10 TaxID=2876660 RepID=UPI001CD0F585|nr:ParB/RepB/Spo0J family partition protein [Mesorhizobium sp. BR-1-1-10]MBZ9975520.1 ParB/RepB/Spo0J family partition protein [Mesorhizobium sp. BR-1-1-10]
MGKTKQPAIAPVLGGLQLISLSLLKPSNANVRKTGRDEGLAALAASIEAHGLRQNLNVRADGDTYEVIAGGRRLAALTMLVEQGKVPADYPVPCLVLNALEDAEEISLAENELRIAMHPADQFVAFKTLADKGTSNEDIAARFGITPAVVTRRLKLASVSPAIIESYRQGQLSLEEIMAFTLSTDHKQQERVWRELAEDGDLQAWRIKRELTEGMVEASRGKMAKFVGLDAYEAAGGVVFRDLFSRDDDAYMQDADLLKRLYDEKVEEAVALVEAEGWAWVEYWEDTNYDRSFDSVRPEPDEDEDGDAEEMDEDEEIEDTSVEFTDDEKARSGAIVSLSWSGDLNIRRGLVERKRGKQPEDEVSSGPAPEFSAPMTTTLTQHRTAAIRMELVNQPAIALRSLAHCLVGKLLMGGYSWQLSSCLSIDPKHHELDVEGPEESRAHAELKAVIDGWKQKLPAEKADLWKWMVEQPDETVQELTVLCTALTAFDVSQRAELKGSKELVDALGLDMHDWWAPSLDGFISRMKKSELARMVREVGMDDEAKRIESMKKADAVTTAYRALDGRRWIPATLRTVIA